MKTNSLSPWTGLLLVVGVDVFLSRFLPSSLGLPKTLHAGIGTFVVQSTSTPEPCIHFLATY